MCQKFQRMQMQRYFLQFSYFGRKFSGLQKQNYRPPDLHTFGEEEQQEIYKRDEGTVQVRRS